MIEDVGRVHTLERLFTPAELDDICALGDKNRRPAKVDYAPEEARQGTVGWFHEEWLDHKFRDIVDQVNQAFYQFDLHSDWKEPFQYAHYGVGDHFHWHVDMGPRTASPRKLSFSLQLSEPEEYEGGDLQMQLGCWTCPMPKERGVLIAFPSWLPHRVTNITKGERRSLVVWAHGPAFR